MSDFRLAAVEGRFADIIWRNEPVRSGVLVKLCADELEWKRTTTYTVLKKLCDRGIFKNVDGIVSSIISRDDFYAIQGEKIVDEAFNGSLPAFIAAFTSRKTLTQDEISEIQKMIDTAGEV